MDTGSPSEAPDGRHAMMRALIGTFFRSFFLQTLWNFERMQNVGFAFSMAPLLRRLSLTEEEFQRLLRRQLDFFNTHPYLSTVVMGAVYAKEKSRSGSREIEDPTIRVLKNSMGGAFGAVGDHVIWGTWRPFCAVLALGVGALVAHSTRSWVKAGLWWIGCFLILFNAVHLFLRWRGLYKAATEGVQVVTWIQSLKLQSFAEQIRRLGLGIITAIALAYLVHWRSSAILIWLVSVLLGSIVLKRWNVQGTFIFYLVIAVALGLTWIEGLL